MAIEEVKNEILKQQAQDPRHDQSAFKSNFNGHYEEIVNNLVEQGAPQLPYPEDALQPDVNSDYAIDYKFNEDQTLEELKRHINKTYNSHYSKEKFQATEFIIDGGHGTGFCIGNILKYAQRYGKKGSASDARRDLMKILHYAVIQLHVHDTEND